MNDVTIYTSNRPKDHLCHQLKPLQYNFMLNMGVILLSSSKKKESLCGH